MLFNSDFVDAIKDYQYLLERNYSAKNILKIIGDRFKLNTIQRSFLYRGITTDRLAKIRKLKLVQENALIQDELHIDAYNIFITIHSYLKGKPVFVSYDGFLRDAGELKGKISKTTNLQRAVNLSLNYLSTLSLSKHIFYIDSPVNNSNEVKKLLKEGLEMNRSNALIKVSKQVDHELKSKKVGILATSDSEIIDSTDLKIFDLAKNSLMYHFDPHFINLQQITNTNR